MVSVGWQLGVYVYITTHYKADSGFCFEPSLMHMQEAKKAVIDKDASNLLHGLDDNVRMRNPAGSDITGEQSRSPAAGHSQSTTTIGVYCTGVLCRCTSHLFKSFVQVKVCVFCRTVCGRDDSFCRACRHAVDMVTESQQECPTSAIG